MNSLRRRLLVTSLERRIAPATFTVINLNDSGTDSLRDCISKANAGAGNTVNFKAGLTGTITLTTGEIAISKAMTITGTGSSVIALSGNNASRIFNTQAAAAGSAISISGLTLTNATASSFGGAILAGDESLTFDGCIFSANKSVTKAGGAIGMLGAGTLTARDCTFANNVASTFAGAIVVAGFTNTTLLQRCTISGNTAGSGGAMYVYDNLIMESCTLSGNSATTGRGGAIYCNASGSITQCTISGNSAATDGGAVSLFIHVASESLVIRNSTITNNSAGTGTGGGVRRVSTIGSISIESSIISGNSNAAAPDISSAGTVNVKKSAVGSNLGFTMTDLGGNLAFGTNLKLGSLANNGGPTFTHLPANDSPLLEAGSNPAALASDQRGLPREVFLPDIGAVEIQSAGSPGAFSNVLANVPESSQGSGSGFTQSGTTSIAFGNTVVVAFNDSGSFGGGNNRFTGYARSTDSGATFTDLGALTAVNNDAGEPVLARSASTGRIFLATIRFTGNGLQIFRSDDNGLTFGVPVNAFASLAGANLDGEWIAVDNFAGAGQGNLYVIARDFGSSGAIQFTRSTDGGATFSSTVSIVTGNQGAYVVVNADHSVNVFWLQSGTPQTIRTRRSTDGGLTFGATTIVATLATTSVNGDLGLTRSNVSSAVFRTNAFPSAVANPVTPGVLYCTYADNPAGVDRGDIFLTQSNDFGATWSSPARVNTDATTNDQWQPSAIITPDGLRLSIGFHDRRLDANNTLINYFVRVASLSGTTTAFAPDVRISDTSFPAVFGLDSVVNPVYMGDRDQGTSTTGRFYYTWGDNRLGGPDIRVSSVSVIGGGPTVFSAAPNGKTSTPTPISFDFDRAINPASFAVADDVISFTRDGADIKASITGFSFLNGNTTLQISHTTTAPGVYTLRLGTQILSAVGNLPQDNDFDFMPGEVPDDEYVHSFVVPSPTIISSSPTGITTGPITSVTLNFDQVMDQNSFSVAGDVVSFTGPAGKLVPFITGFTWVTDQQLRVEFTGQTLPGNYSMVLNPTINNAGGFPLDIDGDGIGGEDPGDRFTASFSIGSNTANTFGYHFVATPIDPSFDIQPGGSGVNELTSLTNADDAVATVNLGTDTFNYYGVNYSSVFVSTNGNLHFGTPNNEFTNTNLTSSPPQAFICPLWDDLVTTRNIAPDDVVLFRIANDQLVVNWRNVHYIAGATGSLDGITFQIVLQLNTGAVPGAIEFHYTDLAEASAGAQNNASAATIGIKDASTGPNGDDPLLVGFNGSNPALVATGKAIRIFKNAAPTAEANGPYSVASGGMVLLSSAGTFDPDGNPLTFLWDLDNDGTFGETGPGALRGNETGPSPTFNAAGAPGGANPITLRVFDSLGEFDDDTAVVNVGTSTVTSILVNNGAVQRSRVTSVTVVFNSVVNFTSVVAAAFTLARQGGSGVNFTATAMNVGGHTEVTLNNFTGAQAEFGSLIDGRYTLTALASQITNLDGNGDGTPGDDFVLIGNPATNKLFRLFGDADGNGLVDGLDFGAFRNAFNTNNFAFDFDGSSVVDGTDFGQFRQRFGMVI